MKCFLSTISVFPLFQRCLEVVYGTIKRDTISSANIPADIKDILLKMKTSPHIEFKDYKYFSTMLYKDVGEENEDAE